MKRVALECGGKSPHVVMADADIEAAAEGIAWGIYYNQGETCHAGSRVIAHASIRAELVAAIAEVAARADPARPSLRARLADGRARSKRATCSACSATSRSASAEGARVALGGKRALEETGGYYVEPTILDDARNDMRIAQEEIFGPVVVVIPFADEAEAMRLANDTIYGLAAAVWTRT